jgi:hypothetical protein
MAVAGPTRSAVVGVLPPEDQVGRLGVMYVRALLAQAALANEETSPGEDHLATDLNVNFRAAPVRVQVKAGRTRRNNDGSYSVSVTEKWRRDWSAAKIPVYLVYVRLEHRPPVKWFEHPASATTVHAHAYWVRVNGLSVATVRVPTSNRLTLDTFKLWHEDIETTFGVGVKL